MTYLPDVDVWLGLVAEQHVHHSEAKAWLGSVRGHRVAFCRVTEMGLLRLVTNAKVMGPAVISPGQAWRVLDSLRRQPEVCRVEEPPGTEAVWRELTDGIDRGHSFWTDAYLAAVARSAGCTLVTFDRGFRRRHGLKLQLLGDFK